MSWLTKNLQGSLDSIKNQVASSLNQVLNDEEEDEVLQQQRQQHTSYEAKALAPTSELSSREREMEALLIENEAQLKRFADDNKSLRREIEALKSYRDAESERNDSELLEATSQSVMSNEECMKMVERWNEDHTKRSSLFIESLELISNLKSSSNPNEQLGNNVKDHRGEAEKELELTQSKLCATEDKCKALLSQRDLLLSENHQHNETINELKESLITLRSSVSDLEDSLKSQNDTNTKLQEDLLRSKAANEELVMDMQELNSRAMDHEKSFHELNEQMERLNCNDDSLEALKEALGEKQEQMDGLKSDLDDKRSRIESMSTEALLYKDQYENLLGEYNQYLEDLEALQKKNAMQEQLKGLLQEQNEQLEKQSNELKAELDHTRTQLETIKEKEENRNDNITKLEDKAVQLEASLLKELSQKRILEQELEEREHQIKDLKGKVEDQIELDTSNAIESLKKNNERLEQENFDLKTRLEEITVLGTPHLNVNDSNLEDIEADDDEEEESKCFEEQSEHLKLVESELERYKQQLSDSELSFRDHSKQFQDLQAEMDDCITQMEEERKMLNESQVQLEECKKELEAKTTESDSYREKLDHLQIEYGALLNSSSQDKEAITKLDLDKDSLKREFQEASEKLELSANESKKLKEEYADLNTELLTKIKSYEELEANYHGLQSAVDEKEKLFSSQMATKEDVIHNLQKELKEANSSRKDRDESSEFEKQQLINVLNDKSRELTTLRNENGRLKNSMGQQCIKIQEMQESMDKHKMEQEKLSKETVEKLSLLIRDKDVDLKALTEKNESLKQLIERQRQEELGLQQKLREREEQLIQLRKQEQEEEQQPLQQEDKQVQLGNISDETSREKEVLIKELREQVHRLEMKLSIQDLKLSSMRNERQRKRFHSESLQSPRDALEESQHSHRASEYEDAISLSSKVCELQSRTLHLESEVADKNEELLTVSRSLEERDESLAKALDDNRAAKRKIDSLELYQADAHRRLDDMRQEAETLAAEKQELTANNRKLEANLQEKCHSLSLALNNLQQLKSSSSLQSSSSVQSSSSLQSQLSLLSSERDALKLQCSESERQKTELQREMNAVIEKKRRLEIELERLREHLIKVEETYTKDAIEGENRAQELRKKLRDTEERLRSTAAQSTSVRNDFESYKKSMNEKFDSLRCDRDRLSGQMAKHETQKNALDNLTMVLEGFQREKENDLKLAQKDFKDRLERERSKQARLESELSDLRVQLAEANEGLTAANRLSQQLDFRTEQVDKLKMEMEAMQSRLESTKLRLEESKTDEMGKVDKTLIKNLVVGYSMVSKDWNKAQEALKVIATVLDFNAEERVKTGLVSRATLPPGRGGGSTRGDESLTQAFVQFLQNESTPQRSIPKLPVQAMVEDATRPSLNTPSLLSNDHDDNASGSSFVSSRSSSSILRHALNDSNEETEEKPSASSAKAMDL